MKQGPGCRSPPSGVWELDGPAVCIRPNMWSYTSMAAITACMKILGTLEADLYHINVFCHLCKLDCWINFAMGDLAGVVGRHAGV